LATVDEKRKPTTANQKKKPLASWPHRIGPNISRNRPQHVRQFLARVVRNRIDQKRRP
jgi:hypothetical protein